MKKTLTTSIAAIAVAGMIGGGTFADWSSTSDPFANESGAGILQLSVDSGNSEPVEFTKTRLAPGVGKDTIFHLASSDGLSVPNAVLTLKYSDGDHWEDGCNGDELADETTNPKCDADVNGDGTAFAGGQFAENAELKVRAFKKTTTAPCPTGEGDYTTVVYTGMLGDALGTEITIPPFNGTSGITVKPGESLCLRSLIHLPSSVNDSMQGDWVDFDLTFILEQL